MPATTSLPFTFRTCCLFCCYAVCVTAGYLLSYFNRPLFPEWCSHGTWHDTMVRIAGSYFGHAEAFKAVADHYGWTHIVLLSDDATRICWYGAKSYNEVFANDDNYTFTWLRLGSDPSDEQLDEILQQIRSRTRGILCSLIHRCIVFGCTRQAGALLCTYKLAITRFSAQLSEICL